MKFADCRLRPDTKRDLERVIEPLASYISATAQPRAALASALAVLFHEVEATNQAAYMHLTTVLENDWS